MDVRAVRDRVWVAVGVAIAAGLLGVGAWALAWDQVNSFITGDGPPEYLLGAAYILWTVAAGMVTAACVGWVMTATSPDTGR